MKKTEKLLKKTTIANKKASFHYTILKKYSAGIVLSGTEVKAIRYGKVSINEAFCYFKKEELFIKNMNVGEYAMGTIHHHIPNRERKLLLNRKEMNALLTKIKEKGLTIVPILLTFSGTDFVKIEIGLAQGKKLFDKRDSIKDRENKRQMDRLKKMKR